MVEGEPGAELAHALAHGRADGPVFGSGDSDVEFALGLPEDYKIAGGVTKRVLREGMRGVLPEKIRARADKLGFATPEEVWLRQDGTPQFREALRGSVEATRGILKPGVLDLFEEMVEGKRVFSSLIWRMISFGVWTRVFGVRT